MALMSALSMTLSLAMPVISTAMDSATIAASTTADQEDVTLTPTTANLILTRSMTLSTQDSTDTCQAVLPPLIVLILISLPRTQAIHINHRPSEAVVYLSSTHTLLPSTAPTLTLMVT